MPSTPETELSRRRRAESLPAPDEGLPVSCLPETPVGSGPQHRAISYSMENPTIISATPRSGRAEQICVQHVAKWARKPDPGSDFEQRTRWLRNVPVPERLLVKALRAMRYDGLIFIDADGVIAHVFFQRHPAELRMFSVAVAKPLQGLGLAEKALEQFVRYARQCPGIQSLRFGANGHDAVRHICRKFHARQETLGLELDPETGFARIVRNRNLE